MTTIKSKTQIIDSFGLTQDEIASGYLERLRRVQIAGARHGKAGYYPDGDFSSDADWCNGIGAEINALETALDIDDGAVFDLYSEAHSALFRDGTINPSERDCGRCFHFQFSNGCGNIPGMAYVSVWARSVEEALELAAEYLSEHYRGHIMSHDDPVLADLFSEALAELDPQANPDTVWQDDNDLASRASEQATADLIYTESGYLKSWNWWVDESDMPPCARRSDRQN